MSQTKIHYFQIPDEINQLLNEFFDKQFESKKSSFFDYFRRENTQKNKADFREINNIVSPETKKIIDICLYYLNLYGFHSEKITNKNYYLEAQKYTCTKNDKTPLESLILHEDDETTTHCKVNTIVFYLEKTEKIIGGDLLVKINNKDTVIPIMSGMTIIFRGDLLHSPTPIHGEGVRKTIVFQLERRQ